MNSLAARAAPVGLWMSTMENSSFCRRCGSILWQALSYQACCSGLKAGAGGVHRGFSVQWLATNCSL
jgi:hypothetical protein